MSSTETFRGRLNLHVEVLGEVQLNRTIQGRLRRISDWSPVWRLIIADLLEAEERQFSAEGAYGGNPAWAPLSPKYAAWKTQNYPGAPILTRTSALRHAMTHPAVRIQPLELRAAWTLRVGRWDLPALDQTGTRHMPARKVLNLTRFQRSRWVRFLRSHIFEQKLPSLP